MIVAVDQPNYIPWKGYFDLIHDVDMFVFYTDVQYTTRDWRNRNIIRTPNGDKWLTVPCGNKTNRRICDVKMADHDWQMTHFQTLRFAYGDCRYYDYVRPLLEDVYLNNEWEYLQDLDIYLTKAIARDYLGIETEFVDSRNYSTSGVKHERLLSLLQCIGADVYESGPTAKNYIVSKDYSDARIELRWKSYEGYPEYPQNSEIFNHNVSIIDLLCNVGEDAPYYIWGWREDSAYRSWSYG